MMLLRLKLAMMRKSMAPLLQVHIQRKKEDFCGSTADII